MTVTACCIPCLAADGRPAEPLVVALLGALMLSPGRLAAILDGLCDEHRRAARREAEDLALELERGWRARG